MLAASRPSRMVAAWEAGGSTIRNGSCGDPVLTSDVPRIVRALESLGLLRADTSIAVDGGPLVMPSRSSQ